MFLFGFWWQVEQLLVDFVGGVYQCIDYFWFVGGMFGVVDDLQFVVWLGLVQGLGIVQWIDGVVVVMYDYVRQMGDVVYVFE